MWIFVYIEMFPDWSRTANEQQTAKTAILWVSIVEARTRTKEHNTFLDFHLDNYYFMFYFAVVVGKSYKYCNENNRI